MCALHGSAQQREQRTGQERVIRYEGRCNEPRCFMGLAVSICLHPLFFTSSPGGRDMCPAGLCGIGMQASLWAYGAVGSSLSGSLMMRAGLGVLPRLAVVVCCIVLACTAQPPPPAVLVSEPAELQNAVVANVEHIVISQHMDLFDLEFSGNTEALLTARGTKSIRVRSYHLSTYRELASG